MENMEQSFGMIGKIKKCFVIEYPSKRFGYVGNVPLELCKKNIKQSIASGEYTSMVFETKQEAIDFAKSKNIQVY